ncbi:MAG: cytochrome b [Gammaproteobacteria bacterium]|nr:cytochrome b [Gammaproteobacteria bacterium]
MKLRNSNTAWGMLVVLSHWLSVILILGVFILGLWMVELTYYHSWYHKAPQLHKSIGLLLFALTVGRILWRLIDPRPQQLLTHSMWEQSTAKIVHTLLYVLLLAIMVSGYLISTADGRAIEIFNWFEIPALLPGFDKQEDIAGDIHYWLAISLIFLASFHGIAAIKHHTVDKDNTLKRILGKS